MSGIIQYSSFCDKLTSLSDMSSRFIQTIACVRMSFLSKTKSSSIVCSDNALLMLSSIAGYLACPPVLFKRKVFLGNPFESGMGGVC